MLMLVGVTPEPSNCVTSHSTAKLPGVGVGGILAVSESFIRKLML